MNLMPGGRSRHCGNIEIQLQIYSVMISILKLANGVPRCTKYIFFNGIFKVGGLIHKFTLPKQIINLYKCYVDIRLGSRNGFVL